jgi:hypothetical protein
LFCSRLTVVSLTSKNGFGKGSISFLSEIRLSELQQHQRFDPQTRPLSVSRIIDGGEGKVNEVFWSVGFDPSTMVLRRVAGLQNSSRQDARPARESQGSEEGRLE